jgi:hypothetical protein
MKRRAEERMVRWMRVMFAAVDSKAIFFLTNF